MKWFKKKEKAEFAMEVLIKLYDEIEVKNKIYWFTKICDELYPKKTKNIVWN